MYGASHRLQTLGMWVQNALQAWTYIQVYVFFFCYVTFCSVLCRSWNNEIPVQGVCQ
jgi:hypothetical protein